MYYFYPFYYGTINNNVVHETNYRNHDIMDKKRIYYPLEEAFTNGNILISQYSQYKNYIPKNPTPRSEKEKLLLSLIMIEGSMHDLTLLLDVFPRDGSAQTYFEELKKMHNELRHKYVKTYGPLQVGESETKDGIFDWGLVESPYGA